jgi:hypothetical protein
LCDKAKKSRFFGQVWCADGVGCGDTANGRKASADSRLPWLSIFYSCKNSIFTIIIYFCKPKGGTQPTAELRSGSIVGINNLSGHYLPDLEFAMHYLHLFNKMGINTSKAHLTIYDLNGKLLHHTLPK